MKKKNVKVFFGDLPVNISEAIANIYGLTEGQRVSERAYYKLVQEQCTNIEGIILLRNKLRHEETRN